MADALMRLHVDFVQGYGIPYDSPNQSVYVNGQRVATVGSLIAGHFNHLPWDTTPKRMVEGSRTVFIENRRVCAVGDKASCNHRCVQGSPDTFME